MVTIPMCAAIASSGKFLIVLHQETSSPGRVGLWLQNHGYDLDIRRPRFGDELPKTLQHHAGAVIFGGPMSANDEHEFVQREIDWINVPLAENKPFLGICLGAQMTVRALGGKVYRHSEGHAEIGYYPIEPTSAGRDLTPDWPEYVYHWHSEGFDVPRGAELLAKGCCFPNQAFRVGQKAYGIQFHPEVTYAMMNRWTVLGAARLASPNACGRADHFRGRAMYDYAVRQWLDGFMHHWVGADQIREQKRAVA